jgi:hypothetical protein
MEGPTPAVAAARATKRGRPAKQKAAAGGISIEDVATVKKLCDRLGASKVKDLASVLAK